MFQVAPSWELFGFDVRLIGRRWRSAWREFLWGSSSPVIARLDETVRVRSGESVQYYYAGKPVYHGDTNAVSCEAVLLPPDSVLSKTLNLPLAAEIDLDAIMALEMSAHNPFPPGEGVAGWTIIRKTDDHICIGLAFASARAILEYLAQHYECRDSSAYEVWARIEDVVIVLEEFGEHKRRQRYRRRLVKVACLIAVSALLVVALLGSYSASKYFELQRYQEIHQKIQREASGASQAREVLLAASEAIAAVNAEVARYPNPHVEIARLTRLLGDDASIISFSMSGSDLQVRGRARDAAAVVQELTAEPAYEKVTSPQAITKMGSTGLEEFHLDIKLAQGGAR
jgi:general secretion pathway protein L